jgi:signal transduction histidine kinase
MTAGLVPERLGPARLEGPGSAKMNLAWLFRDRSFAGRNAASVLDWLVALGLMLIALLEIAAGVFAGSAAAATAAQLIAILPVAFRRVAPLPAIIVSTALSLLPLAAYGPGREGGGSIASAGMILLLTYAVGRRTHGARLGFGAVCSLLMTVGSVVARESDSGDLVVNIIVVGGTLALGMATRAQTERAIVLAMAADRARREQAAAARAAVQAERARIARELHDVVAHKMGLIVLQAGGARSVLARDPDRAREALGQVEEMGRQTLAEMRHVVDILDIDESAARRPLPCLERLPALIAEARGSGLNVDLRVEGPAIGLPAGLELAAYRLIEEALTNVHKHAPTACADVRLNYEPDGLRIEVRDDGGPTGPAGGPPQQTPAPGYGLIGMRERVNLYGGRMEAGPLPVGGFRVAALLPLSLEPAG